MKKAYLFGGLIFLAIFLLPKIFFLMGGYYMDTLVNKYFSGSYWYFIAFLALVYVLGYMFIFDLIRSKYKITIKKRVGALRRYKVFQNG